MRRLGSLLLVLASSLVVIVEPVLAAPPPPALEDPIEGPVEGPQPPSEPSESEPSESEPSLELPPPSIEPGVGEPGSIEFAAPLPERGLPNTNTNPTPPPTLGASDEEIGKAPASGGAFLAGGLWLVPVSAGATTVLVLRNQATQYNPGTTSPGIITAGVGLGVIGMSMIGIGIYRSVALQRWARRHRVIALPQGSGLVTSGTLALVIGLGSMITGIRGGDIVSGVIGGVMIASSPIQIAIGTRLAVRYGRTGGWRRTRYTLTPAGFRMQF
jgi:hypothetical protein